MKLRTVRVRPSALDVRYFRAGAGEPLLYLHHMLGLVGWEPALARLAESFDVIAPYAPGWGPAKDDLERIDPGPLDITLHNGDLLAALGVERAHVVGIGIGAWMAAELAAISPARVRKLVLINPQGIWLEKSPGDDPFAQHPGQPSEVLFSDPSFRQRFLFEGKNKLDAHVEELLDLRAAAKFLWPIPETGVRGRLPRIEAPTLVATSERDAIVPAAHGPAWRDLIPGAELVAIRGAGHVVELEQPDRFATLVKDFLLRDRAAAVA